MLNNLQHAFQAASKRTIQKTAKATGVLLVIKLLIKLQKL